MLSLTNAIAEQHQPDPFSGKKCRGEVSDELDEGTKGSPYMHSSVVDIHGLRRLKWVHTAPIEIPSEGKQKDLSVFLGHPSSYYRTRELSLRESLLEEASPDFTNNCPPPPD